MPPPLFHPALHAGTPSLLSFRKDGRRAAATPPEPGRFSPQLGPLRRARCARPGPLEQPHHQQPAVLPEQLFPVRTGPPAHSGVFPALPAVCRGDRGHLIVRGLCLGCRESSSHSPFPQKPPSSRLVGHSFGQLPLHISAGRCGCVPVWDSLPYTDGSGPCIGEAAQPEEQAREQTGEHWSEEDTHGTVLRGIGTGTGGWILERKRRMRCAGMGRFGYHLMKLQ